MLNGKIELGFFPNLFHIFKILHYNHQLHLLEINIFERNKPGKKLYPTEEMV